MAVKRRSCRETVGPSSNPMDGSSSSATKPSHFFKIIVSSTLDNQKLKIPVKFAHKFDKELSGVATITVPNGRTWQLGLERAEKRILFVDGWQEFMEYHSISYGYLLVFKYNGYSKFNVCIFDKSATEIDYPSNGQSSAAKHNFDKHCLEDHEEGAADNDDDEILEPKPHLSSKNRVINECVDKQVGRKRKTLCKSATSLKCEVLTRSKKCKLEAQIKTELDDNVNENEMHCPHEHDFSAKDEDVVVNRQFSSSKMSKECKKAIRAAKRCKRTHPSFLVLLRKSNIYKYFVDVPAEFVKKYMLSCSEFIQLEGFNGKQWPVQCKSRTDSRMNKRIARGMRSFMVDNNLKEGDVCVFELIEKKGILLKVSIHHAAEHA